MSSELITLPDGSTAEWKGPGWYRFKRNEQGKLVGTYFCSLNRFPTDDDWDKCHLVCARTRRELGW